MKTLHSNTIQMGRAVEHGRASRSGELCKRSRPSCKKLSLFANSRNLNSMCRGPTFHSLTVMLSQPVINPFNTAVLEAREQDECETELIIGITYQDRLCWLFLRTRCTKDVAGAFDTAKQRNL